MDGYLRFTLEGVSKKEAKVRVAFVDNVVEDKPKLIVDYGVFTLFKSETINIPVTREE